MSDKAKPQPEKEDRRSEKKEEKKMELVIL